MFSKVPLIGILAILPALLVVADVTPTSPGPGYVANAGSDCMISWNGDTSSSTTWKSMSIQLMTGDNFNMIPLTTVVQNVDGTKSGTHTWTCPQVTPNAAIYFYQFTSPNAVNREWTTRFTIASSSGQTTPPPNPTQPGGQAIPWGTGKLNDPSTAVPPPAYLGNGGTPSPPTSSTSGNPTSTNPSTTNPTSPGTTSATSATTPTVSSSLSTSTTTALTTVGLSATSTPSLSTTVVIAGTTPGTTPSGTILPTSTSINSAAPYTRFLPGLLLGIYAPVFMALF